MASIGFVVGDSASPQSNESSLKTFLENNGHTVTYLDDGAGAPASGSYDALVVSESGVYGGASGWAACDIGTLILGNESGIRFAWQLYGIADIQSSTATSFTLDTTHDIAGTLTSPVEPGGSSWVYQTSGNSPAAGLEPILYNGGLQFMVAVDTGATLADSSSAAARRVWWGWPAVTSAGSWSTVFNDTEGGELLLNAIDYVVGAVPSVTHDLAGSAASTSSTTAEVSLILDLRGSATSASSTTGAIGFPPVLPLNGSALSTSSTTARWGTVLGLAGSATSTSSAVGYVLAFYLAPADDITVAVSEPTYGWAAMALTGNPLSAATPEPNPLTASEPLLDGWEIGTPYFEE